VASPWRLGAARPANVPEAPVPGADGPPTAPERSAGDGLDVAAAFDAHAGELLGFATSALGDRAAAEDAVQEVFVRAWRSRDRYGPEGGSVRTWLFAITRNVVVDVHRARARRPRLVAPPDPGDAPHADHGLPTGADPAAASVDRLTVLDALADLSAAHREVVVEVHLAGTPYADLAARTGVPVATLRTRMFHALRALRRALDDPPADADGSTAAPHDRGSTTTQGGGGRRGR